MDSVEQLFDCLAGFYTRKVKYTQETFTEKLSAILEGFPRLQDIHPFRKFYQFPPHGLDDYVGTLELEN